MLQIATALLSVLPVGDHATLHPADATLYFELPALAQVKAAWAETAIGQLLADEEVLAAVGGFMGEEDANPVAMAEELLLSQAGPETRAVYQAVRDSLMAASISLSIAQSEMQASLADVSKIESTLELIGSLQRRLANYRTDNGAYPGALGGLDPLFEEEFADAWGNPFHYAVAEGGASYTLRSWGADGQEGGSGEAADLPSSQPHGRLLLDDLSLLVLLELDEPARAQELADGWLSMVASMIEGGQAAGAAPVAGEPEGAALMLSEMGLRMAVHAREQLLVVTLGVPALAGLAGESTGLSEALATSQSRLPETPGVTVLRGFSSLPAIFDELGQAMQLPVQLSEIGQGIDLVEVLLGAPASMLARGGDWRIRLHGGRYLTDGFVPDEGAMPSLFGPQPLDDAALGGLHPDAVLAWVGSIPDGVFDEAMAAGGFPSDITGSLEAIEQKYGLRIERAFSEALGESLAFSMPPLRSLLATPPLFVEMNIVDRPKLLEAFDTLGVIFTDEIDGGFEELEYRKVPFYVFSAPEDAQGPSMGPIPNLSSLLKACFVVFEDRLLMTTSTIGAKREVRRRSKGGTGERPAMLEGIEIPAGAVELTVADWPQFLGRLYDSLRALAPMLGQMGGGMELPFDVEALPESVMFTRFFAPSVRHEAPGRGGMVHRAESSMGPELPVVAVLGGAMAWLTPALTTQRSDARVQLTRVKLRAVEAAVMAFSINNAILPDNLELLILPDTNGQSYLGGGAESLADAWDRPLHYALDAESEKGYVLRSLGPDGVDQAGAGDDISVR